MLYLLLEGPGKDKKDGLLPHMHLRDGARFGPGGWEIPGSRRTQELKERNKSRVG